MQALICQVSRAVVECDGRVRRGIAEGLLVLLNVTTGDGEKDIEWMADRLRTLRRWLDFTTVPGCPPSAKELLLVTNAGGSDPPLVDHSLPARNQADTLITKRILDRLAKRCGQGIHIGLHDGQSGLVVEARLDGPVVNLLDSRRDPDRVQKTFTREGQWHKSLSPMRNEETQHTHHYFKSALLAAALTLGGVLPLGGCNTLEGTGRATMEITQGIADDARSAVNALSPQNEQDREENERPSPSS